jgi:lipid-binding SYLF domain-containing protein
VIAKLDDGSECRASSASVLADPHNIAWSAPSAIGTAGLGVGGQAGAEMTDFLVVLNSRSVSQL